MLSRSLGPGCHASVVLFHEEPGKGAGCGGDNNSNDSIQLQLVGSVLCARYPGN